MQWRLPLQLLATAAALIPLIIMEKRCPDTGPSPSGGAAINTKTFRTPLVPWLPGAAAFFNWYLLAQLTWQGLWMVGAYILASLALYLSYGYRLSVGATSGCVVLVVHASLHPKLCLFGLAPSHELVLFLRFKYS